MITNAAADAENVVGLVYVAVFAPDAGESLGGIKQGSKDRLAIDPDKFHEVFAADLPPEQTAVMAATQCPVAGLGFSEPTGTPAWKGLPSWAVVPSDDKAAGSDVLRSMAERAGAKITEAVGASYVPMMSQPRVVADTILAALAAVPQMETAAHNHR